MGRDNRGGKTGDNRGQKPKELTQSGFQPADPGIMLWIAG
jgi:hypothetical protein